MKKREISVMISIMLMIVCIILEIYGVRNINNPDVDQSHIGVSIMIFFLGGLIAYIFYARTDLGKFKKLFEAEKFVILNPEYYKAVMESASKWSTLPYDVNHAKKAWYKTGFLGDKIVYGYIVLAFKTEMPKPSGSEAVDFFAMTPVESVFIPDYLYKKIMEEKSSASLIEVSMYGTARYTHNDYGDMSYFVLLASDFVKDLDEKELRKIKTIDAFITGIY